MECNKWRVPVLAVVIIVFALWPALIGSATIGEWIVVVAAVLIALSCLKCPACDVPVAKGKAKGKKK